MMMLKFTKFGLKYDGKYVFCNSTTRIEKAYSDADFILLSGSIINEVLKQWSGIDGLIELLQKNNND